MSTDEQRIAIGKIIEDYQGCKTKLAALTSEAGECAKTLNVFAAHLNPKVTQQPYSQDPLNPYVDEKAVVRLLEEYPLGDKIHALLSDLHAVSEQKIQLNKKLKDLGLDIRE